jgi:tRNA pseudouridine38-40 synthase
VRYFIELAYKGKNYFGWQRQPKQISVQEVIEEKLSILLREKIAIVGAGRTDTGVHAKQMYAHFDFEGDIDIDKFTFKLNSFLPNDISIYRIFEVKDNVHARFDATSRAYEYHIHIGKNPFRIDDTYQIYHELDLDKMNEAAFLMFHHTDFQCFSKTKTDVYTYNCDVMNAVWERKGNLLIFHVKADRFLRNMVRAIVGSLLEVGMGKKTKDDFKKILDSKDRRQAGTSVPAQGLFLTEVNYPFVEQLGRVI